MATSNPSSRLLPRFSRRDIVEGAIIAAASTQARVGHANSNAQRK